MDFLFFFFEKELNYDVATLIMKRVYFNNHQYAYKFLTHQLNYFHKEFDFHIKRRHLLISEWCPDIMSQFILLKNREKIHTRSSKIKKDCIYEIIL